MPQEQPAVSDVPDAESLFNLVPLAEGVWAAVVRPDASTFAFANSLIVIEEEGVLVVDTQQSPRAARALLGWIESQTEAPVRWVVNTHGHADHVWGNQVYQERFPNVAIVAHEETVQLMLDDGESTRIEQMEGQEAAIQARSEWLDTGLGPSGTPLTEADRASLEGSVQVRRAYVESIRDLEPVFPNFTFDSRLSLTVGSRTVELLHNGPAHTQGDVVVYLPEEGVLAVGDLLEESAPWLEGAWIPGWADFLARLESLPTDVLVPSHGGVQEGTALLNWQSEFFRVLVAEAASAMVAGSTAEMAAQDSPLERFRSDFETIGVSGDAFDAYVLRALEEAFADELVRRGGNPVEQR
jgi:cyclase